MTRPRHSVRPRYGRITALGSSVAITAVAVLGGAGILPSSATTGVEGEGALRPVAAAEPRASLDRPDRAADRRDTTPSRSVRGRGSADATELRARETADAALPVSSGTGRRVVFSQNRQRVWLVGVHDRVKRTYLVSGSVSDNLDRGSYEVYSRSEQAIGIDDSGTMKYFVRFAHGDNAAIGFHDIPVKDGHPVQSASDLGIPQSHGCIRQRRADAIALWEFAPLGTTVVVV